MSKDDAAMQIDGQGEEIDESLYSRQLYVLGKEAMTKMSKNNILIIGLKGLGVEIAKNVILAGYAIIIFHPAVLNQWPCTTQIRWPWLIFRLSSSCTPVISGKSEPTSPVPVSLN